MNEQKNHVVKWKTNGKEMQGNPLSEDEAAAWVACLNKKYPSICHWMEAVNG